MGLGLQGGASLFDELERPVNIVLGIGPGTHFGHCRHGGVGSQQLIEETIASLREHRPGTWRQLDRSPQIAP